MFQAFKFESSVISYGSKTLFTITNVTYRFESSVISYGSKTGRIGKP